MSSRRVQSISDDLKNVEFETSEEVEVTPTFDSMGLREDLIRGIYAYGMEPWKSEYVRRQLDVILFFTIFFVKGFEKPSAIQQRAIKPIVKGRDVISQ